MTYISSKLARHNSRSPVAADSSIKLGFCRDLAASGRCPPSSVLCNLATVSKITNKYKIQSNLNFKWYADEQWQISPAKTGTFFVNSIVNANNNSNITQLDFTLRNENITKTKNRFAVEFTIEGKPTVMLVPIMLLKNDQL